MPLSELNRAPHVPAMEPNASLQSITYDKFKVSLVGGWMLLSYSLFCFIHREDVVSMIVFLLLVLVFRDYEL